MEVGGGGLFRSGSGALKSSAAREIQCLALWWLLAAQGRPLDKKEPNYLYFQAKDCISSPVLWSTIQLTKPEEAQELAGPEFGGAWLFSFTSSQFIN